MGVTEASIFLTSVLLLGMGFIAATACVLIVNNMIHRWWKPLQWSVVPNAWKEVATARFNDDEKRQEPVLEKK